MFLHHSSSFNNNKTITIYRNSKFSWNFSSYHKHNWNWLFCPMVGIISGILNYNIRSLCCDHHFLESFCHRRPSFVISSHWKVTLMEFYTWISKFHLIFYKKWMKRTLTPYVVSYHKKICNIFQLKVLHKYVTTKKCHI